ncbi:hypothetical protein AB0B86_04175 [Micromonospora sp. NPDC049047]|uniref:hypothetical protein n=1 Tax=Micromonospora sp. NPDC049047 TaxID=3155645 RepID=UPI0033CBD18F
MDDLPFQLADCGAPATIRIEVCSAIEKSGAGSLDGAVYVCPAHPDAAAVAIAAAGFTSAAGPMSTDLQRPCGYVHAYPTGALANDSGHPRWCDRNGCGRRGEHWSQVAALDDDRQQPSIVAVWLVQTLAPTAETIVALSVTDRTTAKRVLLSVGQARALRYRLGSLLAV